MLVKPGHKIMNNIPHIVDTGASIDKINQDFEEWTPLLRHIMENKLLKQEVEMLKTYIKKLETLFLKDQPNE